MLGADERTPLARPARAQGPRRAQVVAPLVTAGAGLVVVLFVFFSARDAHPTQPLLPRTPALAAQPAARHRDVSDVAPHVVLAVLDDAGWDDFVDPGGVAAPRIAALAADGVALRAHYAAHECTPSRGSLLTGRYAANLGLQRGVVGATARWGLPLGVATLPEPGWDADRVQRHFNMSSTAAGS